MKPIALVVPWYGDDIKGGAEQACNYLAHSLQHAGAEVEVFTTCVKEASADRGKNTLEPGAHIESGILVRRFPVKPQNLQLYGPANLKLYRNEPVTLKEEQIYYDEDINSPEMYQYIREHKSEYRCFVFTPYLYGPSYHGSRECPDNCIMIPCFHDESYAHMQLTKEMAERMKGLAFLSKPEEELAKRLYDLKNVHTEVLGTGIDTEWHKTCNATRFRQKYQISRDFILYAGRKDPGKKADQLLEFFCKYISKNTDRELDLVLIGGGHMEIPVEFQNRVHDLGFVSVEDKHDAFAACTILCNPSYFESFSIVIMEGWLAKRPVLVSEHCAVTTNFCMETDGGLYFRDYPTFAGTVSYLLDHPQVADQMGENGFEYVMEHFTHEMIAEKYLRFLDKCLGENGEDKA